MTRKSVTGRNAKASLMAGAEKLLLESRGILRAELIFTITGDLNPFILSYGVTLSINKSLEMTFLVYPLLSGRCD